MTDQELRAIRAEIDQYGSGDDHFSDDDLDIIPSDIAMLVKTLHQHLTHEQVWPTPAGHLDEERVATILAAIANGVAAINAIEPRRAARRDEVEAQGGCWDRHLQNLVVWRDEMNARRYQRRAAA